MVDDGGAKDRDALEELLGKSEVEKNLGKGTIWGSFPKEELIRYRSVEGTGELGCWDQFRGRCSGCSLKGRIGVVCVRCSAQAGVEMGKCPGCERLGPVGIPCEDPKCGSGLGPNAVNVRGVTDYDALEEGGVLGEVGTSGPPLEASEDGHVVGHMHG